MTNPHIITIYEAQHSDSDGYKDTRRTLGYFSNSADAQSAAKGQNSWGGNGNVVERRAVMVDGLAYLITSETPIDVDNTFAKALQDTREEALKKLSPEERRALGVEK